MTNEEYIKNLSRKELAAMLLTYYDKPDYDYDLDDNLFQCRSIPTWVTSDCHEYWDYDYEYALQHECWWLAQEREEEHDG